MTVEYIDTPAALEALCTTLAKGDWLALDTEFMRENTYYPQLCLVQVANDEVIACIDPQALPDLGPLQQLLDEPAILKVLHSARQDLEIFHSLTGRVPAPLFDTQVAATVLGYGDQIGYAGLVKALLDVQLDKAHTRTDWSQRPLDPGQLEYAADDVRYLVRVYHRLVAELEAKGRMEWLAEDFAALADPAGLEVDPQRAWLRIKGANRLKGVQLAVLQALAAWREQQAQKSNRPRRWIVADDVLLELARHMPAQRAKLERVRGLNRGTAERWGATLLELIETGRATPKAQWPQLPNRTRTSPEQDAVLDAMNALLRHQALANQVSPQALGTRRDLEAFLHGEPDAGLRHGWRHALAGETLERFLAGKLRVTVENGQLVTQTDD